MAYLDDKPGDLVLGEGAVQLVDEDLGHVVVGGQLDLELDRRRVVLRFAQIMLTSVHNKDIV